MNEILKKALINVKLKERFDNLFEKHSHKKLFKKADPIMVSQLITDLGYLNIYKKNGKYFEVDDRTGNVSLNLSVDIGIVEFILNAKINGEGCGGPFDYMCTFISSDEKLKAPRFSDYKELKEILEEGFKLYEDIKNELYKSQSNGLVNTI
ncbi:hypothetical protein ACT3CD_16825 [Geofilum sp. OHC36d9]|uniref:hypothetical protein n=1 Tax=Geofilum sp. OHC36d9 TaxID=3458413 RepID=UPI00403388A5